MFMNYFVFRNNTIEPFFPDSFSFSGYDDISLIPRDAEGYLWFYQIPFILNRKILVDTIKSYADKFSFVLEQIEDKKNFVALTMDEYYSVSFTDDDYHLITTIAQYNQVLFDAAESRSNMKVLDIRDFLSSYKRSDLIDWRFYFMSQMGLNPRLVKPFQKWLQRKLDNMALKRKKCLVLDLDNTLWGGIIAEDGVGGIKIGGDYPGNAYLYFQKALLELSKSGIILTVCSKNNEQDVLEAWKNIPEMPLTREQLSAYRINWLDKATNIRELSEELNIGLDDFVFIDDTPSERELIKQMLPMVVVPDFPKHPYELPVFFQQLVDNYFKTYSVTEEDLKKNEQYRANASRLKSQKSFTNFNEYLRSLEMEITIQAVNEFNIRRIAQMTQKTNQFNLTTRRYTDIDIKRLWMEGQKIWCINVTDKFGGSGITGCIIIDDSHIDSYLLSCRILGKGIEFAFLKKVLFMLKETGLEKVTAKYIPTVKNGQVKDFYERCGFKCLIENADGTKNYLLDLFSANLDVEDYYHITIK